MDATTSSGPVTLEGVGLSAAVRNLGAAILENKVAKGWTVTTPERWAETDHVPAVLALVHSEVSEALEAFRHDDRANFAEELADVMIRIVGLAHGLGIDLGTEMLAKVEKNRAREFKHGGKRL
jgi:NTP pyrophosphatase (non-canonical NTP hydrolase)